MYKHLGNTHFVESRFDCRAYRPIFISRRYRTGHSLINKQSAPINADVPPSRSMLNTFSYLSQPATIQRRGMACQCEDTKQAGGNEYS